MKIRTKDADEAAFFWVQDGVVLAGTELEEPWHRRKVLWFVFDAADWDQPRLDAIRNDYLNGKTFVEPRAYAARRAEVKNMIRHEVFGR